MVETTPEPHQDPDCELVFLSQSMEPIFMEGVTYNESIEPILMKGVTSGQYTEPIFLKISHYFTMNLNVFLPDLLFSLLSGLLCTWY